MLNKLTTTLLLLSLALLANAKTPEYIPPFKIISDTLDENIPEGKCLITGVVTFNEETVNEATVKAYNYNEATIESTMTMLVNSNKLGKIRMTVDTATYFLTAVKSGTGVAYVEGVKFKSQHHIEIEIYLPDHEVEVAEKPVIYLYSDKEDKEVNVAVATQNELTFTYPPIGEDNSWNVNLRKEGIVSNDGKNYPYLFWEANVKDYEFYTKGEGLILGQIIQTDTVVSYLENELSRLYLNEKEITDFITYWGPRLQQKEYALVQFKVDEEVNEIAELKVSPQPDWMRRVYMVFTGFEEMPNIKVLHAPLIEEGLIKREGFHVVEWGGSEIEMPKF